MLLGVNVDHVATLRQTRKGIEPDPVMAATLAILGGADGITVHLREDRRHIQDRDLRMLREFVPVELNLEMAATKEMIGIASQLKPDMVTLVPEKRQELTTEGGLDVKSQRKGISEAIKKLHDKEIPVSLFINPDFENISVSKQINADMVEIHTGMYSNTRGKKQHEELIRVMNAVRYTFDIGLTVNAGHGLNYFNVQKIASLYGIRGLYIGHSIISRAVLVGMERAVREMKELIRESATTSK
ncbi:MAG: pyridoxine 5'-phosphate synthase [Nitrospirae bacterium RBG_13_43_8]|nr:MAG: pyridoxine 5'-phosphate synthase [Nitrospirae bacterium RBG_13_43_8]